MLQQCHEVSKCILADVRLRLQFALGINSGETGVSYVQKQELNCGVSDVKKLCLFSGSANVQNAGTEILK